MIHLTKEQLVEIIKHCQKEYPKEACGILAGKILQSQSSVQRLVTKVYKMTNISDNPKSCYFMEPKEQLKVFKEMRQLKIEMLGIYHSHSSSPAYPSERDCEMVFYPDAAYVIMSLKDFNNPKIRAFKITEDKIEELEIKIGE